ncbi:hypothetical protein TNCV_1217861 [Trichonephila clavipes]|nr:hypothetical protein TNCV_1217861 [Trichonephila clavipes]
MPGRIRFVPVYTATRQNPGSKCMSIFRTLFRLGTLGVKRRVFSNSPMMHCARDSFIQDGCCFGLLALDNRINNNPHKHLGRPKRIGYNCPGFGSLQVPIFNKNYIPFRTATAGSDVVQSGRPIFDDFFQHLSPYIGSNTANVVFQMVRRLWLIRIDQ